MTTWFQRVGSAVPRGFSRYFILELLKERACSGKEIIDHAINKSNGVWKPSPGLIYPLLGRLLDEGMIEERDDGKYQTTEKGKKASEDIEKINDTVRKQLDVMFSVGKMGRIVAIDLLEKISTIGSLLSSNITNMTTEETERYRKFLQSELEKLEKKSSEKKRTGKRIKIE